MRRTLNAQAWSAAQQHAHRLNEHLGVLAAAASLAGVRVQTSDTSALIALSCDPGDAHRRRTWEASNSKGGRCGHWSGLHALGVTLRAWPADQLGTFTPYPEPKPLEHRQTPVAPGVTRETVVDPHDEGYIAPPIPASRKTGRVVVV